MERPACLPLSDKNGVDISPEAFDIISRILKNRTGFNLLCYKDKCIRRRIGIRIRATHSPTADAYCELLLENDAELDHLLKVLTIHVSHFFRNPPTFAKLKGEILPALFKLARQEGRESLSFWSVGCAAGEEPFTLALILKEAFAPELMKTGASIIATDVDATTLNMARTAIYTEDRLVELPEEVKVRHFTPVDTKYHLKPEIREMVSFRQSDLSEIDSFIESDLILCRNVLIYFEREHQEKILLGFAKVLRTGGFLVLGKSETLTGEGRKRFRTICPIERIYQVI
jgi:chemotaxis protein methyltransferase CheR